MNAKVDTFSHTKDQQASDATSVRDLPDEQSQSTHSAKTHASFKQEPSLKSHSEGGLVSTKFFIIVISFIMGLYEIGSLATFMYQKEILKIEPETMQMIFGFIAIPWCIKPVFGYLFDEIIYRIKKVKYIIIVSCCVRLVVFSVIAHYTVSAAPFYLICFTTSMCTLSENIVSEYTLVVSTKRENENNPDANANHLPIFFGFRALGSLVGNFFGGRIIKYQSIQSAFFVSSMLPFVVLAVALMYKERSNNPMHAKKSFAEEVEIMKKLVFRDKVLQMILFICLINLTPNFDVLYTFYMTDYLKFNTEDLANFSTFATVCYIIGLFCYSVAFKNINPKRFFVATNFFLWVMNISFLLVVLKVLDQWGWDKKLFCLLTQGVYSFVAELNYMPILAIWCSVCPKNLEATSITLFTGLMNFSGNLSNYIGAFLIWVLKFNKERYEELWIPLVIQNSYLLVAMIGVMCVTFPDPRDVGLMSTETVELVPEAKEKEVEVVE